MRSTDDSGAPDVPRSESPEFASAAYVGAGTSVPSLAAQMGVVARRSVLRTLRQPVVIAPTILFPLFFLAINATALKAVTRLPHFPTSSYLTFALANTFVLAGITTVSIAGGGLAEDIHTGFLSRLSLTPLRGSALVLGHLAGSAVIAAMAAVLYVVVGRLAGATFKTGFAGAVAVVAIAVVLAVGFASLGVFAALAGATADAVQAVFPLLLVMLFLSSQALPRDLITQAWFRDVATYNPMSYFVEAPRSLIISGWDGQALALGIGFSMLLIAAMVFVSSRQLRAKVRR
jgi:ABC-2 type transport system permease protein